MIGKLICIIWKHDFYFPLDEKMASFVGGICKRCLKLTPWPELPKSFGDVVRFEKLEKK